jgi:hypothetical protein
MSDALLAQSAVDRLTSGAHTLMIEGPSYRQRHRTGAPPLTPRARQSDAHSHHQVVPCSWQRGGPVTLPSDNLPSNAGSRHYASAVPDHEPKPTHVLTTAAVRWGIDTLGAKRLHPTFVMYLYLRVQWRSGRLAEASASSDQLLGLIDMPGNPTKPYYFPLIDRGKRAGKPLSTFWRASNIPGSWSPGSIRRLQGGGWLGATESAYAMPDNHTKLALSQMLYNQPVSALALGAYFLRNDGFVLSGDPGPEDVVAAFRARFDYPDDSQEEFSQLFTTDAPHDVSFSWFEAAPPPSETATDPDQRASDV